MYLILVLIFLLERWSGMNTFVNEFGENAGKVWRALQDHGPLSETKLIDFTFLSEHQLHSAVGWLARENKICKNNTVYKLGDTNLTSTIGENAGRVWTILSSQKEADVTQIARLTQLPITDTLEALGWLARENKIEMKDMIKQRKRVMAFWLK